MKIPQNTQYVLFGGSFVLANKLQLVADQKGQGLSTKQWFLLRNLKDLPTDPPPTITTLAKETDTTRQNVSKMLEVLQRQGYVVLQGSTKDHRSQTVTMTPAGHAVLQQMAAQAAPFFDALFCGVSPAECEAAAAVVVRLIENLNRMQEEAE